jgi:flagellar M-ring protein FliF
MSAFMDFYNSYSKSARTGLIAGAALVLIGLIATLWWLFTPRYQLLFGNLRETDAAEVTKSLTEWKIPYRFTDGGTGIEVPEEQVYDTRMKLVSAGVPSGGHVGFELFDHSDFGVTEFAQRVNYQRALQGELERSVAALPGVEAVRVHLTIRRPGLFVGQDDSSKASVAVTMTPGEILTPAQVAGIRNLVASAVDGLAPTAVVVLGPNGVFSGGGAGGGAQDGLMSQNEETAGYEGRVRERISDLLSQVFHISSYKVSVDARLNFDQVHEVNEHLVNQGQDGNGLLVHKRTSHTGAAAANGATSTTSTTGAAAPAATENTSSQTQDELDYAHGTEREEISRAPGKVERLSIAVLVPPTLNEAEMDRLRKLITAAAGLDNDRGDRLEISAISAGATGDATLDDNPVLNADRALGDKAVAPPAVAATPNRWFSPWFAVIGLFGLVLGWILASALRPAPVKLRVEEREAVLTKLRTWLAEGGTVS